MLILIWSFPIWVNMYLKIDEDIKLMFRNGHRLFFQVVTFYLELLFVLKGCCWVKWLGLDALSQYSGN